MPLVLGDEEPDEVRVSHPVRLEALAPRHRPGEDALDHPRGDGAVVVPGQVLPVDEQVVIPVQLPELAVDHVEVLVAEVLRHLVTNKNHEINYIISYL